MCRLENPPFIYRTLSTIDFVLSEACPTRLLHRTTCLLTLGVVLESKLLLQVLPPLTLQLVVLLLPLRLIFPNRPLHRLFNQRIRFTSSRPHTTATAGVAALQPSCLVVCGVLLFSSQKTDIAAIYNCLCEILFLSFDPGLD